jgi:tetratricopeptide (TPR) repeat protein
MPRDPWVLHCAAMDDLPQAGVSWPIGATGRTTWSMLPALLALSLVGQGCDRAPQPAVPALGPVEHLEATAAREVRAAHASVVAAPDDVARWVELARALDRSDLSQQSAAVWRGAATLAPSNADWAYRAGVAAAAQLDVDAARASLRLALERDPRHPSAWRALGTLALDAGDTAAARAAFEQVVALRPTWHDGHTGLALVALTEERASDALVHASAAARTTPPQLYFRYLYGAALRAAGRVDEAAPHLAAGAGVHVEWSELSPDSASSKYADLELMRRADRLAANAKLAEAITLYRQALARRPEDGRVRARLGTVLAASGKPEEGLAELDTALARTPDNYYLMMGRADVLAIVGRIDDARVMLHRAIEVWPLRSEALLQLGQLELGQQRFTEALDAFRRAYTLEPALPKTSANVAQGLMLLRDFAGAARVLEEAIPKLAGAPPLDYFALTLQAQSRAGRGAEVLSTTRAAAHRFHGDAARALDK